MATLSWEAAASLREGALREYVECVTCDLEGGAVVPRPIVGEHQVYGASCESAEYEDLLATGTRRVDGAEYK